MSIIFFYVTMDMILINNQNNNILCINNFFDFFTS